MSLIKENTGEAVRDDVLFSIVIPAGSLSFKDYVKGSRVVLARGLKRSPTRTRSIIIGAIVGIVLFVGTVCLFSYTDLQLIAAGWHANADEYLFYFTGQSTALLFLYLFFFGWISAAVWIRRWNYRLSRIRYRASNSINTGYRLELMESGVSIVGLEDDCAQAWQNFTGWGNVADVIHGENVDFIVLQPGSFLWVPKALEEPLRSKAMAFIEQKRAGVAKGSVL